MSNFTFPIKCQQPDTFYSSVSYFFKYLETHNNLQMEQISMIDAKYEKMTNEKLKNKKGLQTVKKVEKKIEESKLAQPEIIKKIDPEVMATISKAEEILKIAEDSNKPKPPPKKEIPLPSNVKSKIPPKSSSVVSKTATASSSRTVSKSDVKTVTTGLKRDTSTKNTREPISKTISDTKGVRNVSHDAKVTEKVEPIPAINYASREKPILAQNTPSTTTVSSQSIELSDKPSFDYLQLNFFKKSDKIYAGQDNIKSLAEMKKVIRKKTSELAENLTYFEEKEKKSQKRFIGKLYSHVASCKEIIHREDESKSFQKINLEEKAYQFGNSPINKVLLISQNVLKFTNSNLENNNSEIGSLLNFYDMLSPKSDIEFINNMVQFFRTWYMITKIQDNVSFLEKELSGILGMKEIRECMISANSLVSNILYFKKKNQNISKKENKISWMSPILKVDELNIEATITKKSLKITKCKTLDNSLQEILSLKIEYTLMLKSLLKIMLEFWRPRNNAILKTGGTKNKNMTTYLKSLKVLFILTYGSLRKIPMFMVKV